MRNELHYYMKEIGHFWLQNFLNTETHLMFKLLISEFFHAPITIQMKTEAVIASHYY